MKNKIAFEYQVLTLFVLTENRCWLEKTLRQKRAEKRAVAVFYN